MCVCVYVSLYSVRMYLYTDASTLTRLHPNIFASKLICKDIYTENIKKVALMNMCRFLLVLLKNLHNSLRACFPVLKLKKKFPLARRWSSIYLSKNVLMEQNKKSYFFAGAVFCKFHIFSVWSSEAVINTGSTGWKASPLIPSKWLLNVNLGFQVFLNASLLFAI